MINVKFEEMQRKLSNNSGVRAAVDSPEAKKLLGSLDAAALEGAAKRGDTAALKDILSKVLSTSEGKALAERVRNAVQENGRT